MIYLETTTSRVYKRREMLARRHNFIWKIESALWGIIALIELRNNMDYLLLQEATNNFNNLINQVNANHKPVMIKGSENDVVVISKEDWAAIEETIYLNSIQGYIDSLNEVLTSPRTEWVNAQTLGL